MKSPTRNDRHEASTNQYFDSPYKENRMPYLQYSQAVQFDKPSSQNFIELGTGFPPNHENAEESFDGLMDYPMKYSDYNQNILDLGIPFSSSPPTRETNTRSSINPNLNINSSSTKPFNMSDINNQTLLQLDNYNMSLNSDFNVFPIPQTPNLNHTQTTTNSISPNTLARFSRFLDLNSSPTHSATSPTNENASPTFVSSTPPPVLSFPMSPLKNTVPLAGELLYLQPPLPLMGFDDLQKSSKFPSSVNFDNEYEVNSDPFVDQKPALVNINSGSLPLNNNFINTAPQTYQESPISQHYNITNNLNVSLNSNSTAMKKPQNSSEDILSIAANAELPVTDYCYNYTGTFNVINLPNNNPNNHANNFASSYDYSSSHSSPVKNIKESSAVCFNVCSPTRANLSIGLGQDLCSNHSHNYNGTSSYSSPAKSIGDSSIHFTDSSPIKTNRAVKLEPGIAWKNVITAPLDKTSAEIIKSQLQAPQSNRKTTLMPGKLDSYMTGPTPEGKFICLFPDCGKEFGRKYNIRSHIQTHLSDRPYKCEVCESRFVRQHDLKRHMKIHVEAKPYECPCGKTFARQDALTRHRARVICVGGFETSGKKWSSPSKNKILFSESFEDNAPPSSGSINQSSYELFTYSEAERRGSQVNYQELPSTIHQS